MELGVLGPVSVVVGSDRIEIGGPKQRTVLAMLIAGHGRTVPSEVIAAAVYGEDASRRRVRNVQTYVSILRSILGDVIVRDGSGWTLHVPRSQVDALRFEDLYESAVAGHLPPRDTARLLRQAQALWRGHPYQDIEAHGHLGSEVARLNELRLAALAARIDADLESGRQSELIGELEGLLVEHPYAERFRAQHMLALYRAGRQKDALASYDAMRSRFVEELGVDPTPDLQRLLQQILEQDPALDLPVVMTGNLPNFPTSFIGRAAEIVDLVEMIRSSRLVTVTGVGGVGKTRLALEAAEQVTDEFPGGVWLVELAAIADPELVDSTVARTLGIDESGGLVPREALSRYLSTRPTLLVLDNCEHLLEPVASLVDHLLRTTSETTVMATSRELLGVPGESGIGLRSMQLPPHGYRVDVEESSEFDGIRLFGERAAEAKRGFQLDAANIGSVIDICRRLDGIPLAIELAANRVRAYPPSTLADLLDQRFRLLTGGSRTALPRQQTLAATIEWSYRLLDEAEQTLFRRLSVFRGGWSTAATGAVAGEALDVIELLPSLVDKSLVVADTADPEPRYRMLETIRQYSLALFEETPEVDAVRARHADWYEGFARDTGKNLNGPDDVAWLKRASRELDNLRLALEWCTEHGRGEQALRIATGFWDYWAVTQRPQEGIAWIQRSRDAAGEVPDSLLATSLFSEAALLERSAGIDPEPLFDQAIETFEALLESGVDLDVVSECYPRALHLLARVQGNNKDDEERAIDTTRKQLAVAELFGNDRLADIARGNLKRIELFDYGSLQDNAEAAARARALSDAEVATSVTASVSDRTVTYTQRAILELELGAAEVGAEWFGRAAAVFDQAGLTFLGDFHRKRKALWLVLAGHRDAVEELLDWDRRLAAHPEAVTNPKHLAEIVADRALVDTHHEQWARTATAWGIYDALTHELQPNFPPTLREAHASSRRLAQSELDPDTYDIHYASGQTMTTSQIARFIAT